jgi:hypothetical protein
VQWQPNSELGRPSIVHLEKESAAEAEKKPKRMFVMPTQNSAFSQIMRQEMGKSSETGPRRLDAGGKQEYKQYAVD